MAGQPGFTLYCDLCEGQAIRTFEEGESRQGLYDHFAQAHGWSEERQQETYLRKLLFSESPEPQEYSLFEASTGKRFAVVKQIPARSKGLTDQQLERAVALLNRYNQDEELEQANQPGSATRRWDRIWKLLRRYGAQERIWWSDQAQAYMVLPVAAPIGDEWCDLLFDNKMRWQWHQDQVLKRREAHPD